LRCSVGESRRERTLKGAVLFPGDRGFFFTGIRAGDFMSGLFGRGFVNSNR
jgi:hypothetical protein